MYEHVKLMIHCLSSFIKNVNFSLSSRKLVRCLVASVSSAARAIDSRPWGPWFDSQAFGHDAVSLGKALYTAFLTPPRCINGYLTSVGGAISSVEGLGRALLCRPLDGSVASHIALLANGKKASMLHLHPWR